VGIAKEWISAAIAAADRLAVGQGHGPIHHFHRFY
jgi:hydroxymethylpyrimidine/phosphomethylpyrimidine kinase